MNSILNDIKRLLGIDKDLHVFDQEIVIHINSAIFALRQIGGAPANDFSITGEEETWDQLLEGRKDLDAAKMYIFLKVRLVFDPPTNGTLMDAMKRQLDETEWRLSVHAGDEPW